MAENDIDPVDPDGAAETKKLPSVDPVDKSQYIVVADDTVRAASQPERKARPAKGPLKPDSLSTDYVVVTDADKADTATPVAATPVATTPVSTTPVSTSSTAGAAPTTATEVISEPVPGASAEPAPQIIYREAPVPPTPRGNRGFGVLLAFAASVVFAVLFAFAVLLILRTMRGFATMSMLANYGYWVPVLTFLVAFIIIALVVNRAGWWAHIISSAIVAVVVWLASSALIVVIGFYVTGDSTLYTDALVSPTAIAAGIIAREVALWAGVIIGRRGKSVRVRNIEAREAFDREQAANVR